MTMQNIKKIVSILFLSFACTTQGANFEMMTSLPSRTPTPDISTQQSITLARPDTIDPQEIAHFSETDAKNQWFTSAQRGEENILRQLSEDNRFDLVNAIDEGGVNAAHILTKKGHTDLLLKLHEEADLDLTLRKLKEPKKGASILH